jgi:dihydrofolate reductase
MSVVETRVGVLGTRYHEPARSGDAPHQPRDRFDAGDSREPGHPRLSFVVAIDEDRGIGCNNQLMWSLPNDLKHFKAMTVGRPVVMGRKTFESMGRPLPSRLNIIVTRDAGYSVPGCVVVPSIEKALQAAPDAQEMAIIGGGTLFQQTLDLVDTIHLTEVHAHCGADTFFPSVKPEEWKETSRVRHSADDKHAHDYSFVTLERVRP